MKKAIAGMLAIGLLFGLGVAAQADISSNLIGHWKFDEAASGTGTGTALDSSAGTLGGVKHDGTINGGAVYTAGQVGTGALTFDRTNDYVDCGGTGTQLQLVGTSYTISWWMKVPAAPDAATQYVITMEDGADWSGGYTFALHSSYGGVRWIHNSSGGNYGVNFAPPPTANVWEQHVMVYDSAATAGFQRRAYVDGVYVNSAATGVGLTSDGNDPLWFGGVSGYGVPYGGALDDIRIYNRALTDGGVGYGQTAGGDIAELYNYVESAAVPEPAGLGLIGLALLAFKRRKRTLFGRRLAMKTTKMMAVVAVLVVGLAIPGVGYGDVIGNWDQVSTNITWDWTSGGTGDGLRTVTGYMIACYGNPGPLLFDQTGGWITMTGGNIFAIGYNQPAAATHAMSNDAKFSMTTKGLEIGTITDTTNPAIWSLTDTAQVLGTGQLKLGGASNTRPSELLLSGSASFTAASLTVNNAVSYVSFAGGSLATFTISGTAKSGYEAWVTAGDIRVDGATVSDFDGTFVVTGDTLSLVQSSAVPEPAGLGLVGLALLAIRRRRT